MTAHFYRLGLSRPDLDQKREQFRALQQTFETIGAQWEAFFSWLRGESVSVESCGSHFSQEQRSTPPAADLEIACSDAMNQGGV